MAIPEKHLEAIEINFKKNLKDKNPSTCWRKTAGRNITHVLGLLCQAGLGDCTVRALIEHEEKVVSFDTPPPAAA